MANKKLQGAGKGALAGGAAGSALGPWGAAGGALVGGALGYFGTPDDTTEKNKQAAFDSNAAYLASLSNDMDARRREALRQSLAMFGPVDSVISKMYGPGAVSPGIDVDSLFGFDPAGGQQMRGLGSQLGSQVGSPGADSPFSHPYKEWLTGYNNSQHNGPPADDYFSPPTTAANLSRSGLNKNDAFSKGTRESGYQPNKYRVQRRREPRGYGV